MHNRSVLSPCRMCCRQALPYRITEGLPVIRPESRIGRHEADDTCSSQEFFQPPLTAGTIEISHPAGTGLANPPVPDVFVADENIDVLPHLALLRCDAIPNAQIDCPERRQRLT
jgi:hypothetical protein